MKFKDLVANSLPRVRGRKSKKSGHFHPSNHVPSKQEPEFSTHAQYFMQHPHPAFESRESSVERSSTVAVVDAPWREGAACSSKADRTHPSCNTELVTQTMTYYTPLTHQQHGMVMSHSADGISSQAMLLASPRDCITGSRVASFSDHYALTGYRHANIAATSETAVNYVGPNYVYHSQHQHHHHHHSHDYHYVYHHHHHDRQPYQTQNQPQLMKPEPLTERNYHQTHNAATSRGNQIGTAEKPRKSDPGGFLRKSFASFRAMRKAGSRSKEKDSRTNPQTDENEKCLVCPYPQSQSLDKNGSHKKASKQSKRDLKNLMKSKKNKHNHPVQDNQSDASWCSDSDAKLLQNTHHLHGFDNVPYTTMNTFPVRECSMESSISHHTVAGSRERVDQHFETASLSGYDSDVTKNRTGRSRSRIKTNPWLPSPQPSLTMGRRMEKRQSRDNNDDFMEDENPGCFPRSASFDHHSQLGVSTFLSSGQNEQKRNIQRHRSLTPVDLKLNLSLPRTKKIESPKPLEPKNHLNDLNTNSTKSRPNSIISPNSEFVALADNIEQLANNISFEYEEGFDTSLENGATSNRGNETTPNGHRRRTMEEKNSKKRKSDSSSPIPNESVSDNAHSPDSGIGCLGSCDGDDSMTLSNSVMLEQSPTISIPSTKSDSRNSTPKRKTSKHNGQIDGNRNEISELFSSFHHHDVLEAKFTKKVDNSNSISITGHEGSRLLVSSSSESLASNVISESDIDNTSYKFVECTQLTNKESLIIMDPLKPQNVTPCLMVDERLDINFRSLPRKLNGKQTKRRDEREGSITISRSKNVIRENECTPSLVLFPNNEKSSSLSLTPVTKASSVKSNQTKKWSRSIHDEENSGATESKYDQIDLKEDCDMVVNVADMGPYVSEPEERAGELVTMDTVDACVQTDFLSDFDTWERKQPTGLSPLDDSFDPVESTRRWLISGNMQGSADTGYSSQPRDSHVFMEEDTALLQLETLSDNNRHSPIQSKPNTSSKTISSACRHRLSPFDYESSPYDCNNCYRSPDRMTTVQNYKTEGRCRSLSPTYKELNRSESLFSECDLSKLLSGLTPPCEDDDFQRANKTDDTSNVIQKVNKRHSRERNLSITDVNKRHSSDSSTSTLTSDVTGVEKENLNISYDKSFNDGYFDSNSTSQENSFLQTCHSKNKTLDDDYHDYVNLPVRYFGARNKSNMALPHANRSASCNNRHQLPDEKMRCRENKNKCEECFREQKHTVPSTFDSHQTHRTSGEFNKFYASRNGNNNTFRCLGEFPNFHEEDRPDYLEFLRDTPIQRPQPSTNQLFIVPGFGPLAFPSGTIYSDHRGNFHDNRNSDGHNNMESIKNLSPLCVDLSSRSKHTKATKPKKEERPTDLKLLSYNCCPRYGNTENCQTESPSEYIKKDVKGLCITSSHVKRKPVKDCPIKSDRCPTVRSYDLDDLAPINRVGLSSSSTSTASIRQDRLGSTRNLAERVAQLRREKEIIYRKIQEVQQQQEIHRQREQFQQHRNLHSQRKEELLETLRILKDKLEEQSKKLQMKCREDM